MAHHTESTLLIAFVVVQILGIATLFCARIKGQALINRVFRTSFLVSLVAVGLATMCAVGVASDWWISCGTTLAVMAVGGSLDCGQAMSDAAF